MAYCCYYLALQVERVGHILDVSSLSDRVWLCQALVSSIGQQFTSQLSCLRHNVVLDARGRPACLHTASLHLSADIRQVTCTRLGSSRGMIVFATPLSGDFLVVFRIRPVAVALAFAIIVTNE